MMEKLRRAFFKFSTISIAATTLVACASASPTPNQKFAKSFKIEIPEQPVTEGGVFFMSISSTDEIRDCTALFQGHWIDFFPNDDASKGLHRYSAVVGVDYGVKAEKLEMDVKVKLGGDKVIDQKVSIPVKTGVFPSEVLHVPPHTVVPTRKDQKQIARDRAVLQKAYAVKTQKVYWDPPAVMPVKDNGHTSEFGTSRVYNGKKESVHLGIDLRAPMRTRVISPLSGRVAVARRLFYTGYTVILDHGYGMFTIYAHNSKLKVKEGQEVKKGQLIALSGATGRVSGPHVHWGVHLHGAKVDPMVLVKSLASFDHR